MSDIPSEQMLMALLAPEAADLADVAGETGIAGRAAGERTVRLPGLAERIEMFARMIGGPDAAITPEIRAIAREQVLDAMAADLLEITAASPQITRSMPEAERQIQHARLAEPAQIAEPVRGTTARRASAEPVSSIGSLIAQWLAASAASFSVMRFGMVAVPLMVLLVGGSVLTEGWLGAPSDRTADAPKMRSLGPQQVDSPAEQKLQGAIAAEEAAHGRSSAAVASRLVELASLYRADRRYAEAQALAERALIIQDQLLGPKNPETLKTINELSAIYRAEGRPQDADNILSRVNQP